MKRTYVALAAAAAAMMAMPAFAQIKIGVVGPITGQYAAFGEQMAMNWRAAELSPRYVAMLEFTVKLTEQPAKIVEADRQGLRDAGFSDRDIWDIASTAAFFNMSNRVAAAIDMRPNAEYHAMAR